METIRDSDVVGDTSEDEAGGEVSPAAVTGHQDLLTFRFKQI